MKKLAIISTHPIQYNAPLFALLTQRNNIEIKVFYTFSQSENYLYDEGFKRMIKWDIPLLDGYEYCFVTNTSKKPSTKSFFGIKNPSIINKIENWKPDAVLIFGWNFNSHLKAMFYFKNKIPVLFRGDSNLIDEKPNVKTLLRRIFLSFIYKNIDYALYTGENNKKYFLKHKVKQSKLIFAPHAIDNERFNKLSVEQNRQLEELKNSLNLKEDNIVILYAGKFKKKKNPQILIKAASIFAQQGIDNIYFVFVGNGELENKLKKDAESVDNIRFLSFQNQKKMPVIYRLGDIFILPSQGPGETWGLAINEAMACGLAVIGSNKVGCAIDLINNKNGYIFKSDDINDLIEKIKLVIEKIKDDNSPKKESLKIIENYSFEKICQAIENLLLN